MIINVTILKYIQHELKFCRTHLDERSALSSSMEEDHSAKTKYLEAEVTNFQ